MQVFIRHQALTLSFAILLFVSPLCTVLVRAQDQPDPERARAFQLYDEAKYSEALPAFEKLAAKYPEDRDVLRVYGFLVIGRTAYEKDAAARKEARRHGPELELPPLPNWDAQLALKNLDITQVPFTKPNGNIQGYACQREIAINPLAQLPRKTFLHEVAHLCWLRSYVALSA